MASNRKVRRKPSSTAGHTDAHVMWITPGRVYYNGLLGSPSGRRFGALVLYIASEKPFRVAWDQTPWVEATLAVISPYVAHRIASDDRDIMVVLIEPETVERQTLPSYLASAGVVADVQLRQHFRNVQARLQVNTGELRADDADFDEVVFGSALPRAALDERIAHALELLGDDQRRDMTAEMLAQHASLSFSRFLHLFKEEVGAPLRTFRSWKRARSLLPYVTQDAKLTDIAQETGYPDAAHFSNSIRNVFGLQPREVFAGSRRLVLYGQGTPTAPPRRRPA